MKMEFEVHEGSSGALYLTSHDERLSKDVTFCLQAGLPSVEVLRNALNSEKKAGSDWKRDADQFLNKPLHGNDKETRNDWEQKITDRLLTQATTTIATQIDYITQLQHSLDRFRESWLAEAKHAERAEIELAEARRIVEKIQREKNKQISDYRKLLHTIWLYVNWSYVTRQLTTEQKDLWADSIEQDSWDSDNKPTEVDRWWRP
jgi:hypothetical protein